MAKRTVRRMVQGWLILVGLLLTFGLVLAAHGAWRRASRPVPTASPSPAPRPNTQAPAPAPEIFPAADGSTGTVALPNLPIPPGAVLTDSGVVAAAPFRWGRATATDKARAMQCLTAALYYEASGESIDGQRAVAQVVLDRVRHPAFPGTVCGVVYQGVERAHCQFSFVCDGALSRPPAISGWSRAARIAAAALSGSVYAPVGLATHYHTYAVTPAWNRAMVMTDMVGAHLFHRWKGYWGTAAAMSRAYAGGEVLPVAVPAPQPEVVTDSGALPPVSTTLPVPPLPGTVAAPTPASAPRMPQKTMPAAPTGTTGMTEKLIQSGDILDKWKDSGRPIDRPGEPRPVSPGTVTPSGQRR
ncbi:cell wall hydrolase [Sphingomonas sanguinis]|uniref:cell wall hydrolase n=1 Tax=Sphingomonas sanguinis TaxID=33051 RepID=UPI003018CBA5